MGFSFAKSREDLGQPLSLQRRSGGAESLGGSLVLDGKSVAAQGLCLMLPLCLAYSSAGALWGEAVLFSTFSLSNAGMLCGAKQGGPSQRTFLCRDFGSSGETSCFLTLNTSGLETLTYLRFDDPFMFSESCLFF